MPTMIYNKLMNNPLFFVFLIPIIVDVLGTVTGQPREYWKSKYQKFEEAVPFAHLLLKTHPLLFIIGCLVIWLPATYFLTLYLPEPLNLWVAMSLFAAHSYNSIVWLRKTQRNLGIFVGKDRVSITLSLVPMTAYILIIGCVAVWGILEYFNS